MLKKLLKRIGWVLLVIWCLGLVLLGARFAQNNPGLIELDLIFWQVPPLSVGLLFSICLLLGVLVGSLMFLPMFLLAKNRVRRLQAELHKIQQNQLPSRP
ncbi:DUF1049 domain-containing protein [Saccharophagus sp. K07]|jgi:uncharacterized integral membrane protein|uniref:lipopolysaccharide assembly protein LapA domain-containing protein n=1 Tax=Saccharophagus sp. K07 TaxID=2283636 RepID=UPI0016524144|nr:DUF1049 domain-containing protein [Saccharophagus sp. K07]